MPKVLRADRGVDAAPYKKKESHPHCAQCDPPIRVWGFKHILEHGSFPRRKYVPSQDGELFSVKPLGQRKLLMSEMQTLLQLDKEQKYTAVYAGAAPGIHTSLLSRLFPNVSFHLYDPMKFAISESAQIKIYNDYFTDSHALLYTDVPNLVFICDIRRTTLEADVWDDMLAQWRWHDIMRPCITSLKFRLPWPGMGVVDASGTVKYLKGDIYLPIWGPRNTTESRLLIDRRKHSGTTIYDCVAYEEEMCYFNRVMRPSIHMQQRVSEGGLDGCYDCTGELRVLSLYADTWGPGLVSTPLISRELHRGLG